MAALDAPTSPRTSGDEPTRRAGTKPARPPVRTITWQAKLRRDRSLLLMTLPGVVLLVAFAYIPMLGNVMAWEKFSPYRGFLGGPWVGFDNFLRVFDNPLFLNAVQNTLAITVFQLVLYFPVPIFLALLLNSVVSPRIRTTIQSIVYLPHFFSWVLVVAVFQQLFGGAGLLSQTLRGLGQQPVDIMTNPDTFLLLLTSQSIWKDAGWGVIIFLAALSTVDPAQYEAAVMDGANRWRRMWHITLPALRPVIILLLILRLGDALTVGFEQLLLQRDMVGAQVSEVIDTYVYFQGVQFGDWGFAAAAGLMKGVVSLVLVLGANKLAHVFGEAGVYKRS